MHTGWKIALALLALAVLVVIGAAAWFGLPILDRWVTSQLQSDVAEENAELRADMAAMQAQLDAMSEDSADEADVDDTEMDVEDEVESEADVDEESTEAITPPSASFKVDGEVWNVGSGLTATNLKQGLEFPALSSLYTNTIGFGADVSGEPGVRTADPGDPNCKLEESCWHINPDNQHDLNALGGEAIDLNEDAFTMCAFSRGTFTFGGETQLSFAATPMHSWLLVMRGLDPGDGDRNTQVVVTDFDMGFMTCTNLPAGARISEDYVIQNFDNMFEELCGAIDHCTSGSLVFYNHQRQTVEYGTQDSPQGELEYVNGSYNND